jgi:hypothetical protein
MSGRAPILVFVGALLLATACFVGSAAELAALGREHSAPTALLATLAIAFALAVVVMIRVTIHAEHQLRSMPAPSRPPAATVGRPPKNGPVARAFGILLGAGFVVVLIAITVSLHSSAVRSAETQHHGVSRSAMVVAVHRESHASRYDSWSTYNYDVRLSSPVGAAATTVLNDPSRDDQQYEPGEVTTVLIDPKDVDYAELPGVPVQSKSWVVAPLLFVVLGVGLVILLAVESRKHRRLQAAAG